MLTSVAGGKPQLDADIRLPGFKGVATEPFTEHTVDGLPRLPSLYEDTMQRRSRHTRKREHDGAGIPENVFDGDNRHRVDNTRAHPFSTICELDILTRNHLRYHGTGVLIGKKLVLTAGHNVFFHSDGGWMESIMVYPALNGNRQTPPFGRAEASSFRSVEAWTVDANEQFDIGAIILPTSLGQLAGWLPVARLSTSTLTNLAVTLAGYPVRTPQDAVPNDVSTMWLDTGNITPEANRLTYRVDSTVGQSGGPIMAHFPQKTEDQFQIVGIHNRALDQENAATRINDAVFDRIVEWLNDSES